MLPSQRRDMGQEIGRQRLSIAFLVGDDFAELHGVPEDDDGGEQVHAGDPVMLAFGGTVADFTPAMEADGSFQRVMGLALVEPDLGAALEIGVQNPVDHEQRPLDAAYLGSEQEQFKILR